MPPERRRRSRSRSRKKAARQRSASSASAKQRPSKRKGEREKEREEERRKEGRKPKAPAAAAADSESEASGEGGKFAWEEEDGGDSFEARVAILEVENATLKAENAELKRRLVEALRGKRALAAEKPGQAPAPRAPSPPVDRRARLAAIAAEPPSQARRHREEGVEAASAPEAQADEEQDDPMHRNAVLLANDAMEAYNEPIPNNIPPEKRLPLVQAKLERFMSHFGDKIQILDLKSGGAVIKDRKTFITRYSCVFRESGSKLKGSVNKRFYFDAPGKRATYCLDFEVHDSLVTATPGTPPDGKLGVRDPRTEHLAVLYEEKGGKITRMWLRPDSEKLGLDPTAGDSVLVRTDAYKAFAAKIAECKGGAAGEFIFHNYHDTPSVG